MLAVTRDECQRHCRRQHARHAPQPHAGIQQQSQRARRLAPRRFAPQIKRFVQRHAHGERQVIVCEFAQQQTVERSTVRDVRHAAERELVALAQPPRQSHGSHEFARGTSDRAQFFIATQFLNQLSRPFSSGQID